MEEEKIAQGTYDFRVMREKSYRYVDKTALLYPLVTRDGDGFFFISRPRRFGKSLHRHDGLRLEVLSHPPLQLRRPQNRDARDLQD